MRSLTPNSVNERMDYFRRIQTYLNTVPSPNMGDLMQREHPQN